ncbi:MAG: hypothetical protein ACXAEX_11190 [Promethearchaeota archaeon]|jgi:hypothetical protein
MNRKLKKINKERVRNLSPSYAFHAPPYNKYSAYQPGGYFKMYHRVEAEKMKRSHNWQLVEFEEDRASEKMLFMNNQEELPSVKTSIKEGILKVEIGDHREEIIEIIPKITPKIEKGMLRVEIGEDNNKKVIFIDFRGYLSIVK